jgi:hypothetical protein
MSQRTSGGVYNRRKSALHRLENQLKAGFKHYKVVQPVNGNMGRRSATLETEKVPFTEADIKRINKEISILKTKL